MKLVSKSFGLFFAIILSGCSTAHTPIAEVSESDLSSSGYWASTTETKGIFRIQARMTSDTFKDEKQKNMFFAVASSMVCEKNGYPFFNWSQGSDPNGTTGRSEGFAYCSETKDRKSLGAVIEMSRDGVRVVEMDPEVAKLKVDSLREGDLILKVDGRSVSTMNDVLTAIYQSSDQTKALSVEVRRSGLTGKINQPILKLPYAFDRKSRDKFWQLYVDN